MCLNHEISLSLLSDFSIHIGLAKIGKMLSHSSIQTTDFCKFSAKEAQKSHFSIPLWRDN